MATRKAQQRLAAALVTTAALWSCSVLTSYDGLGGGADGGADVGAPDGPGSDGADRDASGGGGGGGGDSGAPEDSPSSPVTDADCGFGVPAGWTLTALGPADAGCPSGYGGANVVVEGPDASAACTCNCMLDLPSCSYGKVTGSFNPTAAPPSCGAANNTPLTLSPSCTAFNAAPYPNGLLHAPANEYDWSFPLPSPEGGACNPAIGVDPAAISYAATLTECSPGGSLGACPPSGVAPFTACIKHAGDTSCPSWTTFTEKHLFGASTAVACAGCSCALVDAGCGSSTLTLYTEAGCGGAVATLTIDGNCHDIDAAQPTLPYLFYSYAGAPTGACAVTAPAAPTSANLNAGETYCCPAGSVP